MLAEALKDKDAALRRAASEALGKIGPDAAGAAGPLLDALKKDEDPVVRTNAAMALGRLALEARRIVGPLTDALTDKDSEVRRRAAESLGGVGADAKSAEPALKGALKIPIRRCATRRTTR